MHASTNLTRLAMIGKCPSVSDKTRARAGVVEGMLHVLYGERSLDRPLIEGMKSE